MVVQISDLSDWYVVFFFIITCFLIVINVSMHVLILLFRNDKCMKTSSPLFLALMAFGVNQVLISNILISIGLDSSTMCILTNFFLVSGLAFIVSSILTKNYRVYSIFSNPSATALQLNDESLLFITIIIVASTWILWGITSFASGPIKVFIGKGVDNRFYTFGICSAPSKWFQVFQIILWYVYFAGLFLISGCLGVLTRNVPDNYNESYNVTITAFCYLVFALIFAPLYYIQTSTTNSNAIRWNIQALSVCFLSAATIALLLYPSVWRFYKLKKKENRNRRS